MLSMGMKVIALVVLLLCLAFAGSIEARTKVYHKTINGKLDKISLNLKGMVPRRFKHIRVGIKGLPKNVKIGKISGIRKGVKVRVRRDDQPVRRRNNRRRNRNSRKRRKNRQRRNRNRNGRKNSRHQKLKKILSKRNLRKFRGRNIQKLHNRAVQRVKRAFLNFKRKRTRRSKVLLMKALKRRFFIELRELVKLARRHRRVAILQSIVSQRRRVLRIIKELKRNRRSRKLRKTLRYAHYRLVGLTVMAKIHRLKKIKKMLKRRAKKARGSRKVKLLKEASFISGGIKRMKCSIKVIFRMQRGHRVKGGRLIAFLGCPIKHKRLFKKKFGKSPRKRRRKRRKPRGSRKKRQARRKKRQEKRKKKAKRFVKAMNKSLGKAKKELRNVERSIANMAKNSQ